GAGGGAARGGAPRDRHRGHDARPAARGVPDLARRGGELPAGGAALTTGPSPPGAVTGAAGTNAPPRPAGQASAGGTQGMRATAMPSSRSASASASVASP